MKVKIIKISNKCNNNCTNCINDGNDFLPNFSKVKKEILSGAQIGCEQIIFCGREPSLCKDLFSYIAEARKSGYKSIQMKTNARMFAYEKYCEEILKAGLTEVSVHFYSGEARIHDSFTKVRGSYQQAMAGVKNILNFSEKFFPYNSCSVNLALVVCRENIRTLQKIIFPMLELGINQLFFVANPTLLGDDTEILYL